MNSDPRSDVINTIINFSKVVIKETPNFKTIVAFRDEIIHQLAIIDPTNTNAHMIYLANRITSLTKINVDEEFINDKELFNLLIKIEAIQAVKLFVELKNEGFNEDDFFNMLMIEPLQITFN